MAVFMKPTHFLFTEEGMAPLVQSSYYQVGTYIFDGTRSLRDASRVCFDKC